MKPLLHTEAFIYCTLPCQIKSCSTIQCPSTYGHWLVQQVVSHSSHTLVIVRQDSNWTVGQWPGRGRQKVDSDSLDRIIYSMITGRHNTILRAIESLLSMASAFLLQPDEIWDGFLSIDPVAFILKSAAKMRVRSGRIRQLPPTYCTTVL